MASDFITSIPDVDFKDNLITLVRVGELTTGRNPDELIRHSARALIHMTVLGAALSAPISIEPVQFTTRPGAGLQATKWLAVRLDPRAEGDQHFRTQEQINILRAAMSRVASHMTTLYVEMALADRLQGDSVEGAHQLNSGNLPEALSLEVCELASEFDPDAEQAVITRPIEPGSVWPPPNRQA